MLCAFIYVRCNSSSLLGTYTRRRSALINFSRAKIYFKEQNTKIVHHWKFILEKSPWWGGFYERLIGVMKNLLKAMERARLTYDEILRILIEIESIINSRTLTYMSNNPNESFIAPYHLIYRRHINEKCHKYDARNEITSDQILAAKLQT